MEQLGVDIKDFEDTATLELEYPDDLKPMGIDLVLFSPESDTYQKAERKRATAGLQMIRRGKKDTAERLLARNLEFFAAATKEVIFNEEMHPDPPEVNKAWLKKFYNIGYVREQVDEFLGDMSNFRGGAGE